MSNMKQPYFWQSTLQKYYAAKIIEYSSQSFQLQVFFLQLSVQAYFLSISLLRSQNSGTACSIHTPWAAQLTYFPC